MVDAERTPVVLRLDRPPDAGSRPLVGIPVVGDQGLVAIEVVARVGLSSSPRALRRTGGRRDVRVVVSLRPADRASAKERCRRALEDRVRPPAGYEMRWE